mmetsp:Transcript_23401/g.39465  ORF Transcript_23401/g.39465 Transcript_23401/m.39465 type:complete len:177 (-) Transcript_23401:686-1216(-)
MLGAIERIMGHADSSVSSPERKKERRRMTIMMCDKHILMSSFDDVGCVCADLAACALSFKSYPKHRTSMMQELEKGKPTLSFDLTAGNDSKDGFFWLNEPKEKEFRRGAGLRVVPDPKKTDFWCKKFRSPPADDTNGHALVTKIPKEANKWVGEICFSIDPVLQYDQAVPTKSEGR